MKKTVSRFLTEINQDELGSFSSSHFWFHVFNAAMTISYLFVVYKVSMLNPINIDGITFYTLVVSGLITGNKLAGKFMNMKFGGTQPAEPVKKEPESGKPTK